MDTDSVLIENHTYYEDIGSDSPASFNTSEMKSPSVYVEEYQIGVKALFVSLSVLSLTASAVAITALRRAKKIPETTKFLATGLLLFDCAFILITSIRRFVVNPFLNITLLASGMFAVALAYITVGMMAIDRFLLFYRPMVYVRVCTPEFVRRIALTIWITELGIHLLVRYLVCYLTVRSTGIFDQAALCNKVAGAYYAAVISIILLTSTLCYAKIFVIVLEKNSRKDEKHKLSFSSVVSLIRGFKTTSLILVYLIVIMSTSVAYAVIIVCDRFKLLLFTELRLSIDVVSMINCFFDPFLYVLWFKECRMEVLKMFAFLSERVRIRVTEMRLEVFDIVTYKT